MAMKTINRQNILAVCALAFCFAGYAQNEKELNKTIVVEKEFVPVEVKVTKQATDIEEAPLKVEKVKLKYSDWALPASISSMMVAQSPILYKDESLEEFRKRGYASFAMGNYMNIVGSAGYRIVDNEKTTLGAWFQHNSTNGKITDDGDLEGLKDRFDKQFIVDDKFGLYFSNAFESGKLTIDADYQFSKFNYFRYLPMDDNLLIYPNNRRQKVNNFGFKAGWANGEDSEFQYNLGIGVGYFNSDYRFWIEPLPSNNYDGMKEFGLSVNGGVSQRFAENSFIGLDLKFDYFKRSNLMTFNNIREDGALKTVFSPIDNHSFGMLTVKPHYSKETDRMNFNVGVNVDISFKNGTTFRIAPDVRFDYSFTKNIALALSAVGGNKINTFRTTFAENRYLNPSLELPTTYTLVDAEAAIKFGAFKGFHFVPFVGFSVTKNNMIPFLYKNIGFFAAGNTFYRGMDMKGFKAGAELGYKFGSYVELAAKYTFAPQNEEDGYVVTPDCAEHNIDAMLKVSPIKKLDIALSYNLRALRTLRKSVPMATNVPGELVEHFSSDRMSNISNLNASASYRINDMFSVFCQANNLLGRNYQVYNSITAQEFNILGGISVKF